jgi:hypothetical protein
MRSLVVLTFALMLSACYVAVGINRPGPAYEEAGQISNIAILPAKMPAKIEGAMSDSNKAALRESLPADASEWLAKGITSKTGSAVWAHADSEKPTTGYYMTVSITHLDVGDEKRAGETAQEEGRSQTVMLGYIYNAATGEMVAELRLEKSAAWLGGTPHQLDIEAMAQDIGAWFLERREE